MSNGSAHSMVSAVSASSASGMISPDLILGAARLNHSATAEERQQTLTRPGFEQQVFGLHGMAGGGQQDFLPRVVGAAGFFVKGDDGHDVLLAN